MPQPIDMQSELGRTMAAERIQDAAVRAALLAQQRAQVEAARERAVREHEVAQAHETESEGVDQDGRGKQPPPRKSPTAAKPAQEAVPRTARDSGEDHTLDVTV
jgi:hypothetical protein